MTQSSCSVAPICPPVASVSLASDPSLDKAMAGVRVRSGSAARYSLYDALLAPSKSMVLARLVHAEDHKPKSVRRTLLGKRLFPPSKSPFAGMLARLRDETCACADVKSAATDTNANNEPQNVMAVSAIQSEVGRKSIKEMALLDLVFDALANKANRLYRLGSEWVVDSHRYTRNASLPSKGEIEQLRNEVFGTLSKQGRRYAKSNKVPSATLPRFSTENSDRYLEGALDGESLIRRLKNCLGEIIPGNVAWDTWVYDTVLEHALMLIAEKKKWTKPLTDAVRASMSARPHIEPQRKPDESAWISDTAKLEAIGVRLKATLLHWDLTHQSTRARVQAIATPAARCVVEVEIEAPSIPERNVQVATSGDEREPHDALLEPEIVETVPEIAPPLPGSAPPRTSDAARQKILADNYPATITSFRNAVGGGAGDLPVTAANQWIVSSASQRSEASSTPVSEAPAGECVETSGSAAKSARLDVTSLDIRPSQTTVLEIAPPLPRSPPPVSTQHAWQNLLVGGATIASHGSEQSTVVPTPLKSDVATSRSKPSEVSPEAVTQVRFNVATQRYPRRFAPSFASAMPSAGRNVAKAVEIKSCAGEFRSDNGADRFSHSPKGRLVDKRKIGRVEVEVANAKADVVAELQALIAKAPSSEELGLNEEVEPIEVRKLIEESDVRESKLRVPSPTPIDQLTAPGLVLKQLKDVALPKSVPVAPEDADAVADRSGALSVKEEGDEEDSQLPPLPTWAAKALARMALTQNAVPLNAAHTLLLDANGFSKATLVERGITAQTVPLRSQSLWSQNSQQQQKVFAG
jgi:hypothetical protein